jgi:hypothetical protein
MPQKVAIESFKVKGIDANLALTSKSHVQILLNDGWRIVSTSSASIPELSQIFVTFVLERDEEKTPSNYKGLL